MPDRNHHVAVYALNANGATSHLAEVVSLFESVARKCRGEQIVRSTLASVPGSRLLYSLCKNDMLAIPAGRGKEEIWRVQKFASNYVQLRRHYFAGSPSDKEHKLLKVGQLLPTIGARKISVDVLGRTTPAND